MSVRTCFNCLLAHSISAGDVSNIQIDGIIALHNYYVIGTNYLMHCFQVYETTKFS